MAFMLYKWLISISLFTELYAPGHPFTSNDGNRAIEALHPFFVSVTEIAHNKQEKTLEISCKIFIDDFEATLKQANNKPINLSDTKKQAENGAFIYEYFKKHLKLTADGAVIKLNYIGYEKDSEAVFCYFEGVQVSSVRKLDIENSILQDLTDQQINIMHVTVNGKRQSYKLDYPNKKASFSF